MGAPRVNCVELILWNTKCWRNKLALIYWRAASGGETEEMLQNVCVRGKVRGMLFSDSCMNTHV